MSKRTTIMMDEDVDKELRIIQAHEILSRKGAVSYSKIVNEVLRDGLKVRKRRK